MGQWKINERQAARVLWVVAVLISLVVGSAVIVIQRNPWLQFGSIVGVLGTIGLWWAERHHFVWTRYALVGWIIPFNASILVLYEPAHSVFSPAIFIPLVFALILTDPLTIIVTGIIMLSAVVLGVPAPNPYTEPIRIALFSLSVFGIAVARAVMDTNLRRSRESVQVALAARQNAEELTQAAQAQHQQLAQQQSAQRRLIDLIGVLETPLVRLAEHAILVPLLGALDSRRIASISTRVLHYLAQERIGLVIVDLTGVNQVDASVLKHLLAMSQSIRLLGCRVFLTGIQAEIALSLSQLDISFDAVGIAATPQEALARAAAQRMGEMRGR